MPSLTGHSHRRSSVVSNRSSVDEGGRSDGVDDETVVEPDQGNVLSHIISQLRPGADLSRVVLPTFILEPRSMLERITNFMAHPETLLPMPEIDDPTQRFISVVKFYLSGWHIKPPGVKKPLNPILGETHTCYWNLPDNTKGYYISEQTSHHPPKSSYFYMAPEHHIRIDGCLKPRSKFLGNSAASMMEGIAILRLLNRGKDPRGESYIVTQPNMYARGILFGKMKYELGDHSFVRCPELGLTADVEFKTKGYFGGTYNAIGGTIKNEKTGEALYELSGMWSGEMFIKDLTTGKKDLLFDALKSKPTPPSTRPIEEQSDRDSQKLWFKTAQAVKNRNHEVATDEKTAVEDMQRDEAAKRVEAGVEWQPSLFRKVRDGPGESEEGEGALDWILDANIDGDTPAKQSEQILAVTAILPGQSSRQHESSSAAATGPTETQQPREQHMPVKREPAAQGGDLIDFGGSDDVATKPAPPPTQQQHQQQQQQQQPPPPPPSAQQPTQQQPSQQKQVQQQLPPASAQQPAAAAARAPETKQAHDDGGIEASLLATGSKPAEGPLISFTDDLRTGLKRADTDTRSEDEFLDAES